jgi:hypothetical protein
MPLGGFLSKQVWLYGVKRRLFSLSTDGAKGSFRAATVSFPDAPPFSSEVLNNRPFIEMIRPELSRSAFITLSASYQHSHTSPSA